MKKTLVSLLGSILLLSACSNGDEPAAEEEMAEESETEEGSDSANREGQEIEAADLIDSAIEASNGITSYEARQEFNIEGLDSAHRIRTIMTHANQNEFKLEINNNDKIMTHYVVDGDQFIYQNNELVNTEETLEVAGNDYQTIVESLGNYPEGEVSSLEDGYTLTVNVDDISALSSFIDEETLADMEPVESFTGTIQLYFDAEYIFTGSELTADAVSAEDEITIHSTVDYTNIDNVEMIEKPHDM